MKKYIIIVGGQLFNKGAQAMTFITVDEMAKRYPDYEPIVVSTKDSKRSPEELEKYAFKIIASPRISKFERLLLLFPFSRRFVLKHAHDNSLVEYISYLKNAAAFLDISGYALGSDWGNMGAIVYCQNIVLANALDVPVYLLPQSFGPFRFNGIIGKITKKIIHNSLKYPKYIFAREKEGYDTLSTMFHLDNLVLSNDIVLQNTGIDTRHIYRSLPVFEEIQVPSGSVAIIPNFQTFKHGDGEMLLKIYENTIKKLTQKDKNVFLIFHSSEDRLLCEKIKHYFQNNSKVILVDKDLSCLEFDYTVRKFDYIIASRFHSIVHAYRNGIPAVVIGWAIKYEELTKLFSQEQYQVDIGHIENVLGILDSMESSFEKESDTIKQKLKIIQEENVYDFLQL